MPKITREEAREFVVDSTLAQFTDDLSDTEFDIEPLAIELAQTDVRVQRIMDADALADGMNSE